MVSSERVSSRSSALRCSHFEAENFFSDLLDKRGRTSIRSIRGQSSAEMGACMGWYDLRIERQVDSSIGHQPEELDAQCSEWPRFHRVIVLLKYFSYFMLADSMRRAKAECHSLYHRIHGCRGLNEVVAGDGPTAELVD
jgi:hypothetical protein